MAGETQFIPARLIPFAQTAAAWTSSNPILMQGEVAVEVGVAMKMKIGDGTSNWNDLPYVGAGAGSQTLQQTLDLGNSATAVGGHAGAIALLNSTYRAESSAGNGFAQYLSTGNVLQYRLSIAGGYPNLTLKDVGSAYNSIVRAGALTAGRLVNLPDEGDGTAVDSDLVIHRTKNPIYVDDGGGNVTTQGIDVFKVEAPISGGYKHTTFHDQDVLGIVRQSLTHRYGVEFTADVDSVSALYSLACPLFRSAPLCLAGDGIAPAIAGGTGAGTAPTLALSAGSDDNSGVITATIGSAPAGSSATVLTITFNSVYANNVRVCITPANAAAAALSGATQVFVSSDNSASFEIISGSSALTGAGVYKWNYVVMQ